MVAKIAFLLLAGCALAYPASANIFRKLGDSRQSNGQVASLDQQLPSETVPQRPASWAKENSWAQNPSQGQGSTTTESDTTTTTEASSSTPYPTQDRSEKLNGNQVPSKQWSSGVGQKLDEAAVVRLLLNTLKSEERELNKASKSANVRQAKELVREQEKAVRDFAKSSGVELDQYQEQWNAQGQRNQPENTNVVALLVKLAKASRWTPSRSDFEKVSDNRSSVGDSLSRPEKRTQQSQSSEVDKDATRKQSESFDPTASDGLEFANPEKDLPKSDQVPKKNERNTF